MRFRKLRERKRPAFMTKLEKCLEVENLDPIMIEYLIEAKLKMQKHGFIDKGIEELFEIILRTATQATNTDKLFRLIK